MRARVRLFLRSRGARFRQRCRMLPLAALHSTVLIASRALAACSLLPHDLQAPLLQDADLLVREYVMKRRPIPLLFDLKAGPLTMEVRLFRSAQFRGPLKGMPACYRGRSLGVRTG